MAVVMRSIGRPRAIRRSASPGKMWPGSANWADSVRSQSRIARAWGSSVGSNGRIEAGGSANLAARLPVFHHARRNRGPDLAVRDLSSPRALGGADPRDRRGGDRIRPGRHQRAPVLLQSRLVQRHPGEERRRVLDAVADGVLLLGGDLRGERYLPIRVAIVLTHPLAALDDEPLHRALAGGREPLPDATVRRG